jgi:hypothetical protein
VIEVKWPTTQKVERFTRVAANQILTIREGAGIITSTKSIPSPQPAKPLADGRIRMNPEKSAVRLALRI